MDATTIELLVLAAVGLWIGIGPLIARLGGWANLAAVYGHSGEFQGDRLHFQSARMRWGTTYRSSLTIGGNPRGLYLAVPFMLRIGHRPLLIPWTDISIRERKGRWFSSVELRFRRAPSIPLQISPPLARWLADHAGPAWLDQGQSSGQSGRPRHGTSL